MLLKKFQIFYKTPRLIVTVSFVLFLVNMKVQLKLFILTVFCCSQLATAADTSCPTAQVVANFNASRFSGKWYFVQRYFALNTKVNLNINQPLAVLNGNCSTFTVNFNNKTNAVHVDFQTVVGSKVLKEGADAPKSNGSISWKQSIGPCKISNLSAFYKNNFHISFARFNEYQHRHRWY